MDNQLIKLKKTSLICGSFVLGILMLTACGKDWDGKRLSYCSSYVLSPDALVAQPLARTPQEVGKISQDLMKQNKIQEAIWIMTTSNQYQAQAEQEKQKLKQLLEQGDYTVIPMDLKGSNPKKVLQFENGVQAIFKPDTSNTIVVGAKREVAAYELDEVLKFNIVPMTVLRTIDGKVGSVQYFLKDVQDVDNDLLINPYIRVLKVFDYLMGNLDRHIENMILWKTDHRLIAIDNGGGFQDFECGSPDLIQTYLYYDADLKAKITQANADTIRSRLSPYLKEESIQRVLNNLAAIKK